MKRAIFNEEHEIFRKSFRKFLEREAVPFVEEWEKNGIVPKNLFRKMGENGYLCPWVDEEYGGSGAGYEYSVIIVEEMVRTGTHCFFAYLHSDIVVPYLHSFGNEEQKKRWLPGCVSGEIIASVGMTEPGAGWIFQRCGQPPRKMEIITLSTDKRHSFPMASTVISLSLP